MMKTALDMVDDVYTLIDVPTLREAVNGVVIKYRRPKSSKKEDIVVNALAITNAPLQEGIVNINLHVPNLSNIKFSDIADETQPNSEKIKQLCAIALPLLDGIYKETFSVAIDRPPMPTQDADGSWFANIRVEYQAFQNNYKNI